MQKSQGFTLVELSIVLVIIGLLVAGVTAGSTLIQQAKMRKVITEFPAHKEAIARFKEKFHYPPGDFSHATQYWAGTGDGNGNFVAANGTCTGVIGTAGAKEDVKAWKHLQLAGLVSESYSGDCQGGKLVAGVNIPKSAGLADGGYWYLGNPGAGGTTYGRSDSAVLAFGAAYTTTAYSPYSGGVLSPKDAKALDDKMDDGLAGTGALFALNGAGFSKASGTACVNGDAADASSAYNLSNSAKTCRFYYYLNY